MSLFKEDEKRDCGLLGLNIYTRIKSFILILE